MSAELPRITVVTPSFNQAQFLETTIRSVLGQGYPNLEYLVMDGGSTDGSAEIIRRHESALAFWVSEKDGGQAAAINAAFARATGDILCWLNSDDFFLPGTLHRVAEWLGHSAGGPDLVYGACLFFSDEGRSAKVVRPQSHDPAALRQTAYIIQPSSFWTRRLWAKTGPLDEALAYAFDWDWFLRATAHGQFALCPEILSAYRHHAAHKSGSGGMKRREEILAVVRRHGTPADLACYEFALRNLASLERRAELAGRVRGVAAGAARLFAQALVPRFWKLPPKIEPATLERARGMLA